MSKHSRPPSAANCFRPSLTRLEDRDVPATFTVMNASSSGPGSFYDAVIQANGTPGADIINFDSSLAPSDPTSPTVIPLTFGQGVFILDPVTITAAGTPGIVLDGGGRFSVLNVNAPNVTIDGLTITHGSGNEGGGIGFGPNSRGATVTNCAIVSNVATFAGGGVRAFVPITFVNCTIAGNTSQLLGGGGGGLDVAAGSVLVNCTVTGNSSISPAGGIRSDGVQLVNTIVGGNGTDVTGTITRAPGSIIQNPDGWTLLDPTDFRNGADPMLDPAGAKYNGGMTPTVALQTGSGATGSGAIDTGVAPAYTRFEFQQFSVVPDGSVTGAIPLFTVTFGADSTPIPRIYNAPASVVQSDLNALNSIAQGGGVRVWQGASGYVVLFTGAGFAGSDQQTLSVSATSGGLVTVTPLTDGGPPLPLTLPNDQRGPGFSRTINSSPDAGAFEFGATPPTPPAPPHGAPLPVTFTPAVSPIMSSTFGFVSGVPIVVFVHADGNAFAHGPDGKEYLVGTDVRFFAFADTRDAGLVMLVTARNGDLMQYDADTGIWQLLVTGVESATVTTYRGNAVYFVAFPDRSVVSVGALGTNFYPDVVSSFDVVIADDGTTYAGGIGSGGSVLVVGPGASINAGSDFVHFAFVNAPDGLSILLVDKLGHVTLNNLITGTIVTIA